MLSCYLHMESICQRQWTSVAADRSRRAGEGTQHLAHKHRAATEESCAQAQSSPQGLASTGFFLTRSWHISSPHVLPPKTPSTQGCLPCERIETCCGVTPSKRKYRWATPAPPNAELNTTTTEIFKWGGSCCLSWGSGLVLGWEATCL